MLCVPTSFNTSRNNPSPAVFGNRGVPAGSHSGPLVPVESVLFPCCGSSWVTVAGAAPPPQTAGEARHRAEHIAIEYEHRRLSDQAQAADHDVAARDAAVVALQQTITSELADYRAEHQRRQALTSPDGGGKGVPSSNCP